MLTEKQLEEKIMDKNRNRNSNRNIISYRSGFGEGNIINIHEILLNYTQIHTKLDH